MSKIKKSGKKNKRSKKSSVIMNSDVKNELKKKTSSIAAYDEKIIYSGDHQNIVIKDDFMNNSYIDQYIENPSNLRNTKYGQIPYNINTKKFEK